MALQQPLSEVDVCNLAMMKLKSARINQIDPPSSEAEKLCNLLYHQVRRATLRAGVWNFALVRDSIPADTATPAFGYTKQFSLPNDFVRYVSRHDSLGNRIQKDDYQIEGRKILLSPDDSTIYVRYIYDHKQISQWDPLFVNLMATNLAIELAPSFTGITRGVIQRLEKTRDAIAAEAKAIDGQERPPVRRERSAWVRARQTNPSVAGKFTKFD